MSRQAAHRELSGVFVRFGAPLGCAVKLITGATLCFLITFSFASRLALKAEAASFWIRLFATGSKR